MSRPSSTHRLKPLPAITPPWGLTRQPCQKVEPSASGGSSKRLSSRRKSTAASSSAASARARPRPPSSRQNAQTTNASRKRKKGRAKVLSCLSKVKPTRLRLASSSHSPAGQSRRCAAACQASQRAMKASRPPASDMPSSWPHRMPPTTIQGRIISRNAASTGRWKRIKRASQASNKKSSAAKMAR